MPRADMDPRGEGAHRAPAQPADPDAGTAPPVAPLSGAPITWVSHPAREAPLRLLLAAGVLLTVALAVLWIDGRLSLALVSVVTLTASISPFLFPTRFTLTARAVIRTSIWGRRVMPWEGLRRWEEDRNGILVSPYRRPGVLDELRGIYLRGPRGAQIDAIRAILLERLGPVTVRPRSTGVTRQDSEVIAGGAETP